MSVFFNNPQGANQMNSGPRVVTVYDPVSGCPNAARTNPLITATINVARPSFFRIISSIIRNTSGRTDYQIFIQGPAGSNYSTNTLLTRRLNWTSAGAWDHVVGDVGVYGDTAGTYNVTLVADVPGVWGCNRFWGKLSLLAFEV
jgi:hypothetical protein